MPPKEQQSRAIEVLRFPLAVLVVAIHCYYFNTQQLNQAGDGLGALIVRDFIDIVSIVITDCAVPLFFVISGYLYFFKKQSYSFREYIKKTKGKCRTLLLPYLCWNVIAIAAYPGLFINSSVSKKILGFWSTDITWFSFAGPWDGPLWFLRDLFVVMLFAPIIAIALRKVGIFLVIALMALRLLWADAIFPGLSIGAFLWFSAGAYLSIIRPNFSVIFNRKVNKYIYLLFVISFVLRFLSMHYIHNAWIKWNWMPWIVISMITYFMIAIHVGRTTNRFDKWKILGASSFLIFAMHALILGRISSTFLWIAGKPNVGNILTLLFYIATISLTVIICYFFHKLVIRNKTAAFLLEGSRNR